MEGDTRYRWAILALSGATATLAVAAPSMAMPVLFSEIAEDLQLTLVQVGAVRGMVSFAGLFAGLAGGLIGDRFGTKRTLTVACLLIGAFGALRGFASSLLMLAMTVFLTGLLSATIPMNLHKVCAVWFQRDRLGMANAVISGGMALGFMIGSLISATFLSPWLGGWRNVLFVYGGIAILLAIPWALTRVSSHEIRHTNGAHPSATFLRSFVHVAKQRDVWIFGIALFGVGGAVQGLLGYLPLYLRTIQWLPAQADAALAGFHTVSLIAVLPLALLTSRLGSRLKMLIAAALMTACGIGLLSVADGLIIWVAVLLVGSVRDGFMAVYMTSMIEIPSIGAAYTGTALGLAMTVSRIGTMISPPLGNSLAVYEPRMPFLLWAGMALIGFLALIVLQRPRIRAHA